MALTLAVTLLAGTAFADDGVMTTFSANLTPGEEVNATTAQKNSLAQGTFIAEASMDGNNTDYYFTLTLKGLSAADGNITAAHIHLGAKGVNGPIVAFLYGMEEGQVSIMPPATVPFTLADSEVAWENLIDISTTDFAAAMMAGKCYANVHTTAYPSGFMRGQIYVGDSGQPASV